MNTTASLVRLGRTHLYRLAIACCLALFLCVNQCASPAWSAVPAAQDAEMEQLSTTAMDATNRFDFATALTAWNRMVELEPNNPAVLSNRGNALVGLGRLEEAIDSYDRAIALVPDYSDTYINRGAAYEGLGQWDNAIVDYNRVLELEPNAPDAYNNRGNAEMGKQDWDAAIADFRQAIAILPDYTFAQANLGQALYQVGNRDEAIKI
ncbi:MAG: tetratricopeptide repeat protein, partial [Cyanobacteria bacterium J06555_12]